EFLHMPTTLPWHRVLLTIALAALGGACSTAAPKTAGLDDSGVVVAIRVIRSEPESVAASAPATVEAAAKPTSAQKPETADSAAERGDVFARAGYLPEAIAEYERSTELAPRDAARYFKLGLAYQSMRRFDEALAAYRTAARLEPKSAWAHTAIAI